MTTPTNTRRPTSHIAPFGVRMQPDLKVRLEGAATASGRSLNAEIIDRLENSFQSNLGQAASGLSLDVDENKLEQLAELLVQRLSGEGLLVKVEPGKITTKRITRTPPSKPKPEEMVAAMPAVRRVKRSTPPKD